MMDGGLRSAGGRGAFWRDPRRFLVFAGGHARSCAASARPPAAQCERLLAQRARIALRLLLLLPRPLPGQRSGA